ncbi:MAG: hypothetical protein ABIC04_02220 [Nanoarchaeota archaeon]
MNWKKSILCLILIFSYDARAEMVVEHDGIWATPEKKFKVYSPMPGCVIGRALFEGHYLLETDNNEFLGILSYSKTDQVWIESRRVTVQQYLRFGSFVTWSLNQQKNYYTLVFRPSPRFYSLHELKQMDYLGVNYFPEIDSYSDYFEVPDRMKPYEDPFPSDYRSVRIDTFGNEGKEIEIANIRFFKFHPVFHGIHLGNFRLVEGKFIVDDFDCHIPVLEDKKMVIQTFQGPVYTLTIQGDKMKVEFRRKYWEIPKIDDL